MNKKEAEFYEKMEGIFQYIKSSIGEDYIFTAYDKNNGGAVFEMDADEFFVANTIISLSKKFSSEKRWSPILNEAMLLLYKINKRKGDA